MNLSSSFRCSEISAHGMRLLSCDEGKSSQTPAPMMVMLLAFLVMNNRVSFQFDRIKGIDPGYPGARPGCALSALER